MIYILAEPGQNLSTKIRKTELTINISAFLDQTWKMLPSEHSWYLPGFNNPWHIKGVVQFEDLPISTHKASDKGAIPPAVNIRKKKYWYVHHIWCCVIYVCYTYNIIQCIYSIYIYDMYTYKISLTQIVTQKRWKTQTFIDADGNIQVFPVLVLYPFGQEDSAFVVDSAGHLP